MKPTDELVIVHFADGETAEVTIASNKITNPDWADWGKSFSFPFVVPAWSKDYDPSACEKIRLGGKVNAETND